jgi:hypothetical protein
VTVVLTIPVSVALVRIGGVEVGFLSVVFGLCVFLLGKAALGHYGIRVFREAPRAENAIPITSYRFNLLVAGGLLTVFGVGLLVFGLTEGLGTPIAGGVLSIVVGLGLYLLVRHY